MRGKGQIKKLSEMIDPDIGVITAIGPSHLEFFKSVREIALAKSELAEYLSAKNAILFLNNDDEWTDFIKQRTGAKVILFGKNNLLDFNFIEYDVDDFGRYSFTFFRRDLKIADITLAASGYQNIYNASCAAAVCTHLGVPAAAVKKGLKLSKTSDSRMNVFKKGDIIIIDDCYNASPVSVKCAIETLKLVSQKNNSRSVALLADMFELGQNSAKLHFNTGRYLKERGIDVLIAFGKLSENICRGFAAENRNFYHFEKIEDLKKSLPGIVKNKDTVLIKGSRANRLETVIECF